MGGRGDGDNNLVILDYDTPTDLTQDNFMGHFVYGIDARHVESVICQGRLLVDNRQVVTVDEKDVLAHARAMGRKLWEKNVGQNLRKWGNHTHAGYIDQKWLDCHR